MNVEDLKGRLTSFGIAESAYKLDGISEPETYVMVRDGDQWSVFYSERNYKRELRQFYSEADACEYMLDIILSAHGMRNAR